jgi:hypothetical protein
LANLASLHLGVKNLFGQILRAALDRQRSHSDTMQETREERGAVRHTSAS